MRLRPGLRGDLDDLMIRHCREPVQNILDVSVGIDSATPATRDDRVNHRATPARTGCCRSPLARLPRTLSASAIAQGRNGSLCP